MMERTHRGGPWSRLARRMLAVLFATWVGAHSGSVLADAVPVAIRARLAQDAGKATLTFDLSRTVVASAFVLAAPARVIVDLPDVNFQVTPDAKRDRHGQGLVQAFRFGVFAPGRSRIVIDLAGPARIVRAAAPPIARGLPARLVIELAATDRTSFARAAALAAEAEEARRRAAALPAATSLPQKPVVVIDPGHGGIDAGASSADGTEEKGIVYDVSQRLAATLRAGGRYDVVLTRTGDAFVSLDDRVAIARRAHAALFVSIHADALAGNTDVSGATVYTVSDRASDTEAARIAEHENKADLAGGVTTATAPDTGVADILFDLTRRETRAYTHVFSRSLITYLKEVQKLNVNPVRSAGFVVLKAPEIPSVLIELGYLSSRTDVKALQSPDWRQKASGAIARAVDQFFASRNVALPATKPPAAPEKPARGAGVLPTQHVLPMQHLEEITAARADLSR